MKARYFTSARENTVVCHLCPHRCLILSGRSGKCKVRSNRGGVLYADTYETLTAVSFDPIEKKPLYHFYPGTEIFSLGSLGCNFTCLCCQNYEIAQNGKAGFPRVLEMKVSDIISKAKANPANIGIAYTYNEPFVWFEYMYDIARKAKPEGLKNVVVSNGYINPEPLQDLLPYTDAFNIDLKAFDARSYKEFTAGELPFVLNTLRTIFDAGKHLEITMLIIPGLNDDIMQFDNMLRWISEKLSRSVPLHLSRYFPRYKMDQEATPMELMIKMAEYAGERMDHVYLGNVAADEFQDTLCPECRNVIIQRQGYYIRRKTLAPAGKCAACGRQVIVAD